MSSGVRGLLFGALALIALQTVVQPKAAGRVGGLATLAGDLAQRFLDPSVPAIPDRKGGTAGGSAAPSTPDTAGGLNPVTPADYPSPAVAPPANPDPYETLRPKAQLA